MDWNRGYTSQYYMTLVDPDTLRDTERFEITGGTIKYESTNLRTSADIDCKNYNETTEQLVRVWLDTFQDGGGSSHTPLFTGYTSSPDRNIQGTKETRNMQCYSVLLPASDVYLRRGWYAPAGINALLVIKQLLKPTNFPVEISDETSENLELKQAIIAEQGETNLTMVEKLLEVINWRMWIDGLGTIHIAPYSDVPVRSFNSVSYDMIEPTLTVSYNWFDCPNCVIAYMDDDYAIAKDEDSDTPMSIQNRSREVWYEETDVNLNEGETLQEFAFRRLKELQRVSLTIKYDRRFDPDVHLLDVVELNYPRQSISGNFLITSQSIALGFNAKTSEEVIQV